MAIRVRSFPIIVVAAAALAGCGRESGEIVVPEPPAAEPAPAEFFGVNGDVVFTVALADREEPVGKYLDAIAEGGITFVRSSIDWRRIEPVPQTEATPDFVQHDEWVGALAARGLRWAPTLLGFPVPDWAANPLEYISCGSRAPPRDPLDYATMAALLVERYGRGGSFWKEHPALPYLPVTDWEIWNEPNHAFFFCPESDPARFAALLEASAAAIRVTDPEARVLLGGLAPFEKSEDGRLTPDEFLAGVVEAYPEAPQEVDAVGVHIYPGDGADVEGDLARMRAALEENGFGALPMTLNEVGWPRAGSEGGFAVIEDEQLRGRLVDYMARYVLANRRELRIDALAPYSWVTEEMDEADQEQWFGLADPSTAAPYAAGAAYLDVVRELSSGG